MLVRSPVTAAAVVATGSLPRTNARAALLDRRARFLSLSPVLWTQELRRGKEERGLTGATLVGVSDPTYPAEWHAVKYVCLF
jgi:hypothetical protein